MEPTWGDLKKLNLICSGLNTSNKNQLISAFGSSTVISDLQMCGNANSHFNKDRIDKIILAKVRYNEKKYEHSSDLMFWIDPKTKDFLWKAWIDEIGAVCASASLS